jgi:arylsulfatase A-like enzyme
MKKRPNILWYCTDQQRYDTLSAFGNPHIRTPVLDRLVASGTGFHRAFAQSPICTPSRASFLTGRYPAATRVYRNGGEKFPDHETLVTRHFANAGYDCGLIGKLHLAAAFGDTEPRTDDGYRFYEWSHHPSKRGPRLNRYVDWLRDEKHVDPDAVLESFLGFAGPGVPADCHQTTWATEMALRFINEKRGDQPWLLSVNVFAPHPPFDPPPEFLDRIDPSKLPPPDFVPGDVARQRPFRGVPQQTREATDPNGVMPDFASMPDGRNRIRWATSPPPVYDGKAAKAAYYALIEHIDFEFGRLLQGLEAAGQLDDTVILFHSDHGEMLGDHGLMFKGCRFFDALVRVPVIISWKDHLPAQGKSDAMIELVDLAPTLLEVAGLEIPPEMQGRSLLPLLRGEAPRDVFRASVTSEFNDSLGTVADANPVHATMYRDARYKHVLYHGLDLGELYDLETDPGEKHNLWFDPAFKDLRSDLIIKHFDAMMNTGDSGPRRVAVA